MPPSDLQDTLHYTKPASEWAESLPIGNGRLGAMVYGKTSSDILQLNENSIVYGGPQNRTPKDARKNLGRLRDFIRSGSHAEAEKLVNQAFFATPHSQRNYEPLGTLTLDIGHDEAEVTNYWRGLDLGKATVTSEYEYRGATFKRTVFASYPDGVLVMQWEASEKSEVTLRLSRYSDVPYATEEFVDSIEAEDDTIIMHGTPGGRNSNHFCCVVRVLDLSGDGEVEAIGNCLLVRSSRFTVVISAQTTFRHENPEAVCLAQCEGAMKKHEILLQRHTQDYTSLYNRYYLRLLPDAFSIPTDQRLLAQPDPGLIALYHSRPGYKALPASLQGLWNPSFQPAWGCKYTININTQMNYWPANICNLTECEDPLFDMIERMAKNGEKTAMVMYGCRGWVSHSCTDIWADTDPQDRWMPGTIWPMSGAWLCCHIWARYMYNGDEKFLQRMFPVIKGSVLFLVDYLIEDSTGQKLVTNPSLSPENTYIDKHGNKGVLCEGSTIDLQITHALFSIFLDCVSVLQIQDDLRDSVQLARERLPQTQVGSLGQILEWGEEFTEFEPGHRHTSHLWGVHPGNSITPSKTPELAAAAAVTLLRRAENGGGHTGWSRAWLINMHARIGDGEASAEHIRKLLKDSTMPNMLDSHPPFQIDGNFGGCAGIAEMLIQCHDEYIQIFPACPKEWKTGSLRGVRARNGFEFDIEWEDRSLTSAVARSKLGKADKVLLPGGKVVEVDGPGEHHIV
ncbi:Alpha-L-fucosidase protein [Rutstroemia sp. NJR-2017a BBW]|nr:Alpha-L-fucosidase protein [Rutstroemia sp. NJR-2017a BBW]